MKGLEKARMLLQHILINYTHPIAIALIAVLFLAVWLGGIYGAVIYGIVMVGFLSTKG